MGRRRLRRSYAAVSGSEYPNEHVHAESSHHERRRGCRSGRRPGALVVVAVVLGLVGGAGCAAPRREPPGPVATGPPAFLHVEEYSHPNVALVAIGAGTLIASHTVSVAIAADTGRPALALPVGGPFIQLAVEDDHVVTDPNETPDQPGEGDLRLLGFAALGALQMASLCVALTGMVLPTTFYVRVSPPVGPSPAALVVGF